MALRELLPLKELLPDVLSQLAQDSGRARQLRPLWDDAVGPAIARAATPFSLEGSTLVLTVSNARWASELTGREEELRLRLCRRLGKPMVSRLVFRLPG